MTLDIIQQQLPNSPIQVADAYNIPTPSDTGVTFVQPVLSNQITAMGEIIGLAVGENRTVRALGFTESGGWFVLNTPVTSVASYFNSETRPPVAWFADEFKNELRSVSSSRDVWRTGLTEYRRAPPDLVFRQIIQPEPLDQDGILELSRNPHTRMVLPLVLNEKSECVATITAIALPNKQSCTGGTVLAYWSPECDNWVVYSTFRFDVDASTIKHGCRQLIEKVRLMYSAHRVLVDYK